MVLGTAPKDGKQAALNALFVNVTSRAGGHHRPQRRGRQRAARASGGTACSGCHAHRDHLVRGGHVRDVRRADETGRQAEQYTGFADPNLRPAIVGVFTDLTGPAPPGLSLSATIDTRFSTTPTPLKLAAMLLAIISTVVALVALWRLDRLDGRRMHRLIPARWRTFTATDVVVVGGFLAWHVIGANSSDDGYILQMARVAGHAGYMSNYFRWFGSPEDPFGWYYNLLALMTSVSDASIWMRLPDLVCGIVCWLLAVSRGAAPPRARRSRQASPRCGRQAWCCWRRGCPSTTACAPRARSPPAR